MMRELTEHRTLTAKHFEIEPGRFLFRGFASHIHFPDGALKNGALRDIDTTLNFNAASKSYQMTSASYEAEIGLLGSVRFHNVDHSIEFRLPNVRSVEAEAYLGSRWGKQGKALIWRNIIQDGGHQIVEARNTSLAKIFHFDKKPLSNIVDFEVIASAGTDGPPLNASHRAVQILMGTKDRVTFIRPVRAWNHRGEHIDADLRFTMRGKQLVAQKIIDQAFIDRTFNEAGAWLECDTTASFYAGSGDGYVRNSQVNTAWSTVRTATNGTDHGTTDASLSAVSSWIYDDPDVTLNITRLFFPFNTSSIDASAIISSASVFVYRTGNGLNAGSGSLVTANQASTSALANSDFHLVGAAAIGTGNFNSSAGEGWAEISNLAAYIQKAAWTTFAVREVDDLTDNEPPPSDSVELLMSESGVVPCISATYSIPVIVTPSAASAISTKTDPSVVLGSISVTPAHASAISTKTDPTVSIAFTIYPAAVTAIAKSLDPTLIFGSTSITPAASSSIAHATDPSLWWGSASITPAASSSIAKTTAPDVVLGSLSVTPSTASAVAKTINPRVTSGAYRNTWINKGPGFVLDDIVMSYRSDFDASGSPFDWFRIFGRVIATGVDSQGKEFSDIQILSGGDQIDVFKTDIEWIVIGNVTDPSRANLIYMTSDDANSPYMEMRSGVTSVAQFGAMASLRVRLGNLNGVVDPTFGILQGYGLYSDNVYLRGDMILGAGSSISWACVTGAPSVPTSFDWTTEITGRPANLVALGDIPGYIQSTYLDANEVSSPEIRGNWVLAGNVIVGDPSTGLTTGMLGDESGADPLTIFSGSDYVGRATAPFRVYQSGNVYASQITIAVAGASSGGAGITSENSSSTMIWAGSDFAGRDAAPFRVTQAGHVKAHDADVEGSVKATEFELQGENGFAHLTADGGLVFVNADSPPTITSIGPYGLQGEFGNPPSITWEINSYDGSASFRSLNLNGSELAWGSSLAATGPTLKRTLNIGGVSVDVACYN
jgi:hypothetical protein